MFEYKYPTILLAPYIRYYWFLKADNTDCDKERILPIGCASMVFHRRKSISISKSYEPKSFISGLTTNYSDIETGSHVDMLVVVFQPFGAKAFFRNPMSEFRDGDIALDCTQDKEIKIVEEKIQNETDNSACVGIIESYLLKKLAAFDNFEYKRMLTVVNTIGNTPQTSILSLADIACVGIKQLSRLFTQYVGVNPKEFTRIVRFQKTLFVLQSNPQISFTQLAFECGYYDQPHLIKEFKAFTGYTLSEYITICAPYSDYFTQPQ